MSALFIFLFIILLYLNKSEVKPNVLGTRNAVVTQNGQTHVKEKVFQEHALVNFYDPYYVKDPTAFTARRRRGESYKTNMTAITLHPWGNNVTFTFSVKSKYIDNDVLVTTRACDVFSQAWMIEFLSMYTNIKKTCPVPPGLYGFYNLELPPKNFPLPLPKGSLTMLVTYTLTATKKKILQYSLNTVVV